MNVDPHPHVFSGRRKSSRMAPKLALRLWAQTHCSRVIGRHVLLESPYPIAGAPDGSVVLCIDEHGLAALVVEADGVMPTHNGEFIGSEPWPSIQLHRTAQNHARWVLWNADDAVSSELRDPDAIRAILQKRALPTESCRKLVVAAIESYYQQHVLEPSVAGFLSILEKQFARADLYLFELLQNAVDEGAMSVRVDVQASPPSLRFAHDGKGFSPLDVNGLASVGMSTKATKRAVGFMGIGFKACHKRFARVVITDPQWSFEFSEERSKQVPRQDGPPLPPSGWVLLPRWAPHGKRPTIGCMFELLEPRGGIRALERDVRWLPPTVPPLLARSALNAKAGASPSGKNASEAGAASATERLAWELTWAHDRIECELVPIPTLTGGSTVVSGADRVLGGVRSSASAVRVLITPTSAITQPSSSLAASATSRPNAPTTQREDLWLFLSVHYSPDESAWRAYAAHTRRDPKVLIAERATEEISLFFKASAAHGLPLPKPRAPAGGGRGKGGGGGGGRGGGARGGGGADGGVAPQDLESHCALHALLPTKLELPFMAHLQGPWLLSVDRQDVQSLQDSAWNAAIAMQLPALFVCALRHIAAAATRATDPSLVPDSVASALVADGGLAAAYSLLPTNIERAEQDSTATGGGGGGGGAISKHGDGKGGGNGDKSRGGGLVNAALGRPTLSLLGLEIDLSLLDRALAAEPLVPVLAQGTTPTQTVAPSGGTATSTEAAAQQLHLVIRHFPHHAPSASCAADQQHGSRRNCSLVPPGLLARWLGGRQPLASPLSVHVQTVPYGQGSQGLWRAR